MSEETEAIRNGEGRGYLVGCPNGSTYQLLDGGECEHCGRSIERVTVEWAAEDGDGDG